MLTFFIRSIGMFHNKMIDSFLINIYSDHLNDQRTMLLGILKWII